MENKDVIIFEKHWIPKNVTSIGWDKQYGAFFDCPQVGPLYLSDYEPCDSERTGDQSLAGMESKLIHSIISAIARDGLTREKQSKWADFWEKRKASADDPLVLEARRIMRECDKINNIIFAITDWENQNG